MGALLAQKTISVECVKVLRPKFGGGFGFSHTISLSSLNPLRSRAMLMLG